MMNILHSDDHFLTDNVKQVWKEIFTYYEAGYFPTIC